MHLPADADTGEENESVPIDARELSLAAFVERNRVELIARCREKMAQRYAPLPPPPSAAHGVPRFLQQLVEVLESEQVVSARKAQSPPSARSAAEIGPAAAEHGAVLLQHGFTVDQVVREYGDVCQAVTELALTQNTEFSTNEFRILNRSLDDAIADAVSAHQSVAQQTMIDGQASLHLRLHTLMHNHQRLVGIARHSFFAIKSGQVGITGATGTLLAHALDELLQLAEERLPRLVEALRQVTEKSATSD